MQRWTERRQPDTPDELWWLEHPPVFTQGLAGKAEHVLQAGDIPVIATDRGGQVTYHGPGQQVVYLLIDLRRLGLGVRALVTAIESALIDTLAGYGVQAHADPHAPGVYVGAQKIGSLGLRVKRHCSYHGLALNVDMDLAPFERINPCGKVGQGVTQLRAWVDPVDRTQLNARLRTALLHHLGLEPTTPLRALTHLPVLPD